MQRRLLRYVRLSLTLLRRFRLTLFFVLVLFAVFPWFFVFWYPAPISFLRALHHVYFLLFGQPTLEYVDDTAIEALNVLIPPLGLATVVEGVVRFGFLLSSRSRADKEWVEMLATSYRKHIVVCGAGRIGYRVTLQLRQLGHEVLVIERNGDAHFVSSLRERGVPVLIEDIRVRESMAHANIEHAQALVCATDDDLANINTALEARKRNKSIRVVLRLFDDELADRVRDALHVEAQSASALAAPAFALSAIDPSILHSFYLEEHLMVVAKMKTDASLANYTVAGLRDRYDTVTLSVKQSTGVQHFSPEGTRQFEIGDELTVQARYDHYLHLRDWCTRQQANGTSP
jgi:voltage-gated potassium channel